MTGNTYQTGSHYLTGDVILSGSINIGDNVTGDTINFNGEVNSNILPTTGATFDLGSSGKTWNNIWAENAHFENISIGDITLNSLSLPGDLTVSGTTTLSGSVYVEDLIEKRLVVAGAGGLLTNYSGLTFDNGNLNVSGALEVTNIQGTGSLYLKPDLNDSRLFEIYNTAAPSGYTDIHFLGNADFNFFGDDINYLKIDDTAQTVTIDSTNGIFLDSNTKVNGTLIVTGTTSLENTLTVTGTTIIHGNETVNGILTVTGNTQLGGNLYVSGTLEVLGSSTEVHIQSNTVEINDNIILLNAYSPFERYAGIALYDSGSTGESGSFLWDSLNNYFLMNNNSVSSKVIGTTTNTLGNENSLTNTYFPIATGDNTIGNSLLRYSGTTLSFNTNKFTVDSSSGNVYVDGNVRVNGAGGSNYTGYTSEIVFKNSDDDLGFVSSTDTQTVTTQLLGYQSSDGTLVFSSLIDGGSY
jgi:cytoskeletal protein CcmA (bactofilin family)